MALVAELKGGALKDRHWGKVLRTCLRLPRRVTLQSLTVGHVWDCGGAGDDGADDDDGAGSAGAAEAAAAAAADAAAVEAGARLIDPAAAERRRQRLAVGPLHKRPDVQAALRDVLRTAQGEMALEEFLRQLREHWGGAALDLAQFQARSRDMTCGLLCSLFPCFRAPSKAP